MPSSSHNSTKIPPPSKIYKLPSNYNLWIISLTSISSPSTWKITTIKKLSAISTAVSLLCTYSRLKIPDRLEIAIRLLNWLITMLRLGCWKDYWKFREAVSKRAEKNFRRHWIFSLVIVCLRNCFQRPRINLTPSAYIWLSPAPPCPRINVDYRQPCPCPTLKFFLIKPSWEYSSSTNSTTSLTVK